MEPSEQILAIDIGGSHIKCIILNAQGEGQTEYRRMSTPVQPTPEAVIFTIGELVKGLPGFDKISIGFPGYVRNGIVYTAPNLGTPSWVQFDLGQQLSNRLG